MKFGKRICQAIGLVALGALVSTAAIGQVTSRFAVPGGAGTSTKVTPGSSFSMDVRVDAPATPTIGAAFRVLQTAPATPPVVFQITARDFTGSIYDDTSSGTPDGTVLATPSALLNPDNDDNLGRNTIGLGPSATGNNLFVEKITFSVDAAAPLGTYNIKPTPGGTSAVTDTAFNDYDMAATATFDVIVGQPLSVVLASIGGGTGTVTSDVGAINCATPAPGTGTCSDIYPGSTVTLTATPGGTSTFSGWSGGGCSGTGTCVVTVAAATSVTATFNGPPVPVNLTVTKSGAGAGTVTSAPAGINCGATCVAPFSTGTMVTLTATPTGSDTFAGWSGGGCSGTGTCVVTMAAATTVNAQFDLGPQTLTVTLAGTGTGTVTSAPAGITCPGTCSFAFTGTVTLTAAANAGSAFTGWSGAGCSGTGTCVVTMSAAQAVTATFDLPPVATITSGPTDPSNLANPQFTFTSNVAGSTFQCQLDGGAIYACSSPTTVSVGNGSHSFVVRAIAPGNNVGPFSAPYTWTAAGVPVQAGAIPTLNEWMLMLLALMLGAAGMVMARRKA